MAMFEPQTPSMKFSWKYLFPAAYGLIIYITVRLVNDFNAEFKFWERPASTTLIELGYVTVTSYIIQFMTEHFIRKFSRDKSRPVNSKTIAREFGTILFWLVIIINAIIVPMTAITDDGLNVADYVIAHIIPGLYVMLYFAIVRGNNYLRDYVEQKLQMEKIANDQLQTELKFLKAQYHPHFLFNALNTIYFQMDESVAAAKQSVEKFSELLRYQLYDQQQTVPIRQELEYLGAYIDLQKIRTSEKLQLTLNVDPLLGGQQVYPLLFLPLVENAFKYVGGDYKIEVAAMINANHQLTFRVTNSLPDEIPAQKIGGIGLENLRRRLQLLYPDRHELLVEKSDHVFDALLKIPVS